MDVTHEYIIIYIYIFKYTYSYIYIYIYIYIFIYIYIYTRFNIHLKSINIISIGKRWTWIFLNKKIYVNDYNI